MWMSQKAKEQNPALQAPDWTGWPEGPASALPTPSSQLEGMLFPAAGAPGAQQAPAPKQAARFRDMLNRRRQMFLDSIQRRGA